MYSDGEGDTSRGSGTLQEDLDRLEEGTSKNLMKFKKDKYKILCLAGHSPGVHLRLASAYLWNSSIERDLGILVSYKLSMRGVLQRKLAGLGGASARASSVERKKLFCYPPLCLSDHIWKYGAGF